MSLFAAKEEKPDPVEGNEDDGDDNAPAVRSI